MKLFIKKLLVVILSIFLLLSVFLSDQSVSAYSLSKERPVFLAWPLPSYIGMARISQFPNTPWTWNYLGLNSGVQCPPAFGYLEGWLPVWRDLSLTWEQDAAQADPHQFQMIECYSTGGEAGTNGHEATDIKAAAGTPVYASADGKVAGWLLNNVNSMIVLKHCLGGSWDTNNECLNGTKWYTTYMHIIIDPNFQIMDLDVNEQTQLGVIFNQGDNSHLHFEVGLDKRNYSNYVNPWGTDEAPWYGCMWMDQSLCVHPNPGYERYAFLNSHGRLFVKQDDTQIVEIHDAENAGNIQLRGKRIGLITENGFLMVGDRTYQNIPLGSHDFIVNWFNLGKGNLDYQITRNRVAILDSNGIFKLLDGDLTEEWDLQIKDVQAFSISDRRVGVLTKDGILRILEGELSGEWEVFTDIKHFQLTDSRLGVVDSQGAFMVKEGPLDFEWKVMEKNIRAFQLSGTRVAIINKDDQLLVNDGNLRATWTLQAEHVKYFQLADDRIIIFDSNQTWKIKTGDLFQAWHDINGLQVQNVVLSGEVPIIIE